MFYEKEDKKDFPFIVIRTNIDDTCFYAGPFIADYKIKDNCEIVIKYLSVYID